MSFLEHRIPPPVAAVLFAALMGWLASLPPPLALSPGAGAVAVPVLAAAGLAFDLLGLAAFWRARTTINPLRPDKATALVTGGIYQVTRNPMYVGLAFLLTAWAVHLEAAWPLLGPPLFVVYLTRFQIVPEERVLRMLFGERYAAYAARVRRWL
jgi:protein-S-isoprenylcysteine O-methyltransferase Ste14